MIFIVAFLLLFFFYKNIEPILENRKEPFRSILKLFSYNKRKYN